MNDRFTNWAKEFMEGWKNLDSDKVLSLMAEDVEYFETPLDKPYIGLSKVARLWTVVPGNQRDVEYGFEVLMSDRDSAIINWQLKRFSVSANERQEFDGIFYIKLNAENKLIFFKQWRYLRSDRDADEK